ncbi:aminotransferase class I/II-fold pyridoxal phosphate-dependent enzyme [Microbacterium sp. 18062]|uniref:aminotransferase class I/II-fold pyridoxal phosphate-dependent enzyme n=1 Tax=Microbacterium sp. 18062 TaxID=2681410 RepID=UPI00135C8ACC|nr:aminotransferase class I/II-fold pyridoxal phosphate-dependent enzyme [Microbacterium sp. 18062]
MTVSADRDVVSPEWVLSHVADRTAEGLATALSALIRSGDLAPGTQLPTVRDLAGTGRTSVGIVLAAWGMLREGGLIQTQRRGGTIVLAPPVSDAAAFAGWTSVDLGQSAPDIRLQPALADALLASLDAETLNVFGREYMTDRLRDAVAPEWPFEPQAWTTAGGGTEALLLAIEAAAPPGALVAVDEPVGPGLLDTLRDLGLRAIGVEADDDGPRPDALARALEAGAVAFVFQPGAPFGLRHRVASGRAGELADVLARHDDDVWVIEDDSIGPLETLPSPSLGAALPDRVLRIRSFCKAYGIDVRTSVLAGAGELVDRTIGLRSHGVGSNSRILQNTLAHLIASPSVAETVALARERYSSRRSALLAALTDRGLTVRSGPHSLVVWVEVPDETAALLALARHGVSAGAGSRSFAASPQQPLLRLSVTQLPDDPALVGELADHVAAAARASLREFFD